MWLRISLLKLGANEVRYYLQLSGKTLLYKRLLSRYIDIEDILETEEFIARKERDKSIPFIAFDSASRKKLEDMDSSNDYVWIDDLLETFDFESLGKAADRKLIVWGAGDSAKGILEKYPHTKVEYFVDRNKEKQGQRYLGCPVYDVEKLWEEDKESVFILVAIHLHYRDIKKDLEEHGWTEHVNFASHKYYWDTPPEVLKSIYRNCSGDYTLMFCDSENYPGGALEDGIVLTDSILSDARSYLEEHRSCSHVKIFDVNKRLLGYAYLEEIKPADWVRPLLDNMLVQQYVSILEIYPEWKGFILDGMDEYSVRMMQYCQKYKVPYRLDGGLWEKFGFPNGEDEQCSIGGDNWIRITSGVDMFHQYGFLGRVMHENYARAQERMNKFLLENGVASYIVRFPTFQDIADPTEEEIWCFQNGVDIFWEPKGEEWMRHLRMVASEEKIKEVHSGKRESNRCPRVLSGCRIVQATEKQKEHTIYWIGPCVAAQLDHTTEESIIGRWQIKVPLDYAVKGIAVNEYDALLISKLIHMLDFKDGDIVIWAGQKESNFKLSDNYIDLTELMNHRGEERWWTNIPIHLIELGSKRVADYLYGRCIEKNLRIGSTITKIYASCLDETEEKNIQKYVLKYKRYLRNGTCGAIVMNCNPYTKGHDYLIEQASKSVDWLYVFVVEEDKSFFSFQERFYLVEEHVKRFPNVIALPSGKMILSMQTLPAYFSKETTQEVKVDASNDLRLFSLGIAPAFHITKRFVGEEPFDNVTRQYNENMKRIFPQYHISLIELSRKKDACGKVISATTVRKAIKENKLDEVKDFLTDITFGFLKNWIS